MSKDKVKPHVHAEVIKAWADGQDIEFLINGDTWITSNINSGDVLSWSTQSNYRVKPKPPKVIELYANAELYKGTDLEYSVAPSYLSGNFSTKFIPTDNLKLTFCPVTGKLIAAEVVQHEKADNNE